ncbi:hypothetical protein CH380_07645 [Leptospira adleri]|uniref:Uncharacterized protein n=1 Tax=Leptospira adleri TaxID=2023186 RepID=A0A2M9YQR7_9LEPT|nr:hypothetical protein CH380_07645 [Leptospira adleri]PJZ63111.1 hypothetical protein CH376_04480 [Leptospira adleri]
MSEFRMSFLWERSCCSLKTSAEILRSSRKTWLGKGKVWSTILQAGTFFRFLLSLDRSSPKEK